MYAYNLWFNLFLLIAFIFQWGLTQNTIVYRIGVDPKLFPNITVLSDPNFPRHGNATYQYFYVQINEAVSFDNVEADLTKLDNIDAVIHSYSLTMSIISNARSIPYFIPTPLAFDWIISPNTFYYESPEQMIADASRALLIQLKADNLAYIDYDKSPTSRNLISFNTFRQTLSSFANFSEVFKSSVLFGTIDYFIVAIPLNETNYYKALLSDALKYGQLNPNKNIIISTLGLFDDNFTVFRDYSLIKADIYGFSLDISTIQYFGVDWRSDLYEVIAKDFVRLVLDSVRNQSLSNQKATNLISILSNASTTGGILLKSYGFVETPNQGKSKLLGITVKVRQINVQPIPVDKYLYSTHLIDVNAANAVTPLNSSLIRIAVIQSTAYFQQKPNGEYFGYSVSLLEALQKLSTFKYRYIYPEDQNVTGELLNKTSQTPVGIIKMLVENKADMSIIPMYTENIKQFTQLYISSPINVMRLSMLTRSPDRELNFVIILYPFSYNVWLGILGMFTIMSLGYWLVESLSFTCQSKSRSKRNLDTKTAAEMSFLVVYSSFVTAKLKIAPRLPSTQIFAFVMWFSTLTLIITYASNLLPFLMQPNPAYPFKFLSDLQSEPDPRFKWAFVKDSVDVELIRGRPSTIHLLNTSLTYWPNDTFVDDLNSISILNKNRFILIQNDLKNSYMFNNNCTSDNIIGSDRQYAIAIVMRTGWRQYVEMQGLINQITQNGQINSISNLYFSSGKCARTQDSITPSPQELDLGRLVGLFLLPAIGVVAGLIYVFCAVLISKIERYKELTSREKFQVGETYDGVIHSIESDGVWVYINKRSRPYFIHSSSLNPDLKKVLSPEELGLQAHSTLELKYFGKDPIVGDKRFCVNYDKKSSEV